GGGRAGADAQHPPAPARLHGPRRLHPAYARAVPRGVPRGHHWCLRRLITEIRRQVLDVRDRAWQPARRAREVGGNAAIRTGSALLSSQAMTVFLLIAAGGLAGLTGALLGIGGGVVLVPLLVFGFNVPLEDSVPASLMCVVASSCAAA